MVISSNYFFTFNNNLSERWGKLQNLAQNGHLYLLKTDSISC